MTDDLKAAIEVMDKSVKALFLELPDDVAQGHYQHWEAVKQRIPQE